MNPLQWIESRIWQVGAAAAAGVAVFLGGMLLLASLEVWALEKKQTQLETRIETLVGDLDACRRNGLRLESAVATQGQEIERVAQAGRDARAAAAQRLEQVARENRTLERRIGALQAAPIVGEDQCERVQSADRAVQEAFQ